jgi:hypothetical protein
MCICTGAGLHDRVRPDGGDRLGQPGESVADDDEDVLHAAGAKLVHHPQPEFGALDCLHPDAQDLLLAVGVDPDGQMRGLVAHRAVVSDLADHRVQEDHRPDPVQRSGLPLGDLLEHRVGDRGDQVRADGHVVDLGQMGLDVAHRHAAGVEADHQRVNAVAAAGALGHDLRVEGAGPIPGHLQVHVPGLGEQPLGRGPVARVAAAPTGRIASLIAQMVGQLLSQRPLQHRLGHLLQQPALTQQLHALFLGLRDQVLGQLLIDQPSLRSTALAHRLSLDCIGHRVSSPSRPCGSGSGHALTQTV